MAIDADRVTAVEARLFIEGPLAPRRLVDFAVMLTLASVIATFGVLGGSTATVVGAMIVAPLMTPVMATAAAIVLGDLRRAVRALLLVAAGAAAVVALSALLSFWVPAIDAVFEGNPEIESRVAPGLLALLIALAAGAAAAYVVARTDVADAAPGVAIAISLVPPLCVVGISLARGSWANAGGAALLFLTNVVAILLAGGGVLLLTGFGGVDGSAGALRRRRWGFAAEGAIALLVVVPLLAGAAGVWRAELDRQHAEGAVREWLGASSAEILKVAVSGSTVDVSLATGEDPPPDQALADLLASRLGRSVTVTLRIRPERRSVSAAPG